jgi:hypothetical protein
MNVKRNKNVSTLKDATLLRMCKKLPKTPTVTTGPDAARILNTTVSRAERILEKLSKMGVATPINDLSEGVIVRRGQKPPRRPPHRYHILAIQDWPTIGHRNFRTGKLTENKGYYSRGRFNPVSEKKSLG